MNAIPAPRVKRIEVPNDPKRATHCRVGKGDRIEIHFKRDLDRGVNHTLEATVGGFLVDEELFPVGLELIEVLKKFDSGPEQHMEGIDLMLEDESLSHIRIVRRPHEDDARRAATLVPASKLARAR